MLKRCAVFVGAGIGILCCPPEALACQCSSIGSFLWGGFEEAADVFEGTAVRVTARQPDDQQDAFLGWVEVEFTVIRSWKGRQLPTLSIQTDATSCGRQFELGQVYVVFAYASESVELPVTDMCTRTKGGVWRWYEHVMLGASSWKPE